MTRAVIEALAEVERQATNPTGFRRLLRGTLSLMANTLPEIALVSTAGLLLWNFFVHAETPDFFRMSLVALIPLVVIIVLHMLILMLLPVRWPAIRYEFRKQLGTRMAAELGRAYLAIPTEVSAAIHEERKQVDSLVAETKQVSDWLAERQQAAELAQVLIQTDFKNPVHGVALNFCRDDGTKAACCDRWRSSRNPPGATVSVPSACAE